METFKKIYEQRKELQATLLIRECFEGISLTALSRENRLYLKVLYLLHNVPQQTLELVLFPIYGNHGFAKATAKLMKEGWIYKERIGGENILAVTRKTMQLVFPKMTNVEKIPIKEGSLGGYKAISVTVASYVLQEYRKFLVGVFNKLSKEEKQAYIKNQYIINIVYKKFVSISSEEQEKFVAEWTLLEKERAVLLEAKRQNINTKAIQIFLEKYPFEKNKAYTQFIKKYREKLNTFEGLILLRDLKINEKKSFDLSQCLQQMPTNFFELNFREKMVDTLLADYLEAEVCKLEAEYSKLIGVKQMVEGCMRKNLQQLRQAVLDNPLEEDNDKVKILLKSKMFLEQQLNELNKQISGIRQSKHLLIVDMRNEKMNVSFERLKQNGIYVKAYGINTKGAYIKWVIVDNVSEGLKFKLIAYRVFLINSFMGNLFRLNAEVTYSVEVVTYAPNRKKILEKEILKAKKKLEGFKGEFISLELELNAGVEAFVPKYTFWQNFITCL